MASFYFLAGLNHFRNPDFYISIIPKFLPNPNLINLFSGILEIVFSILLIIPSYQKIGAWGIIGILLLVFPANIQMSIGLSNNINLFFILSLVRLPLQALFIYWAYIYTR